MPDPAPRRLAAASLALVALSLLGAWQLARGGGGGADEPPAAAIRVDSGSRGGRMVVVHVAGAVRRPGVYRMRPSARVDDAVGRAGGATRRADLSQVNLAAQIEDGRQVLVPEKVRAGTAGSAGGPEETAPDVPLNLNTATLEQLDELDGIGPATAQSILDYREEHGGFGSVEELGEVPGIGEVRLASLRERVRV